ncbi:MAG TPA: hypothetical protein VN654_12670, partial [Vicinamibacterales bacterium]|nr:hypothetical protein [Vicinamibacterales bacterium]
QGDGAEGAPHARIMPWVLLFRLHLEPGDGSVQVGIRFLKRREVRFSYLVLAGFRHTKPQSFRCPVQASGKFCQSSVSRHRVSAQGKGSQIVGEMAAGDPLRRAVAASAAATIGFSSGPDADHLERAAGHAWRSRRGIMPVHGSGRSAAW